MAYTPVLEGHGLTTADTAGPFGPKTTPGATAQASFASYPVSPLFAFPQVIQSSTRSFFHFHLLLLNHLQLKAIFIPRAIIRVASSARLQYGCPDWELGASLCAFMHICCIEALAQH